MALYPNESFENNFWKNGLIQAKLNSLNREIENVHRMKWSPNGKWMLGEMLQRMNAYWMTSVSVIILTLMVIVGHNIE